MDEIFFTFPDGSVRAHDGCCWKLQNLTMISMFTDSGPDKWYNLDNLDNRSRR